MPPCSPITSLPAAEFRPARPWRRKNTDRCEAVHISSRRLVVCWGPDHPGRHAMIYGGFEIQSFEAGRGQWHARIQRTDLAPVVIDGMAFPTLEVGFAWSDPDAAMMDAKAHIDRHRLRYMTAR